jgi:hypothetical protein
MQSKKNKVYKRLLTLFILLSFALIVFIYIHLSTKYWNNKSKLSVVIDSSEKVVVTTYDPLVDEITNIYIPKSTQVMVARDLGTWKLGSVWKLSENEFLEGKLVAETITRFFKLPVYVWAGEGAVGFTSNSPIQVIKSILLPYKTNLRFGDKVKLGAFCLRVKNPKIRNIDLSETTALRQEVLVGGEEGYVFTDTRPEVLALVISDATISKSKTRVSIIDKTGDPTISSSVGEIMQVMGAKVTSVVKEDASDFDCEVVGRNKQVTEKIVNVFGCDSEGFLTSESFDIEIFLGEGFAKRF